MNETPNGLTIRRILVALDASPHSHAALETAAELAAGLDAELLGLYVEDINLVRLIHQPFVREVSSFFATVRQVDPGRFERQLRAQAEDVRRALARVAQRTRVRWDFRVARGLVASEVLAAALEADLVILGRLGRSLGGRRRVGSTVQTILSQGRSLTLILEHGVRLDAPVLVVYNGSELAAKAMEVAARLTRLREGRLAVLVLAGEEQERSRLQDAAAEHVERLGLEAQVRPVYATRVAELARAVESAGGGALILPCEGELLEGEDLQTLVSGISNPVLLVR